MIRAGQIDGANLEGALESIERSARSQGRLIDDLLDVSRIASGKLQLDLRPVHIAPVIETAVAAIRPTAEVKGVRVETTLDLQAGFVSGDRERLQQVVLNLLTNAVKFSPERGRVRVLCEREGEWARVHVEDEGIGIAREFLPRVFDRFQQADMSTTKQYGGLGIGLALVKELIEAHGGSAEVRSGAGGGTTFGVRLPVIEVEEWVEREPRFQSPRGDGAGRGEFS
jgi:signal transduction histidine kinase